jgi:hypothetical protein
MKKYSEFFLNRSKDLSYCVVGFEFEFYIKDLTYFKTLEAFNQELAPVKVLGFREYHPDFTPTADEFVLSADLSGGPNMVELITGPMPYYQGKIYLTKILALIRKYGYTNDKSSIHMNYSFAEDAKIDVNDINPLKAILSIDEDEVYEYFPSRRDNVYAKSVKKIIPVRDYDFNDVSIETVSKNLRIPDDKYYGINFSHINKPKDEARVEVRYIGGTDYEKKSGDIIYFFNKFFLTLLDSTNSAYDNKLIDELESLISSNINSTKTITSYDSFLSNFPSISLQVDQRADYYVVSPYYSQLVSQISKLFEVTDSLKDCILNFDTDRKKIEIVDAIIKPLGTMSGFDFIHCELNNGIFENSCIFSSKVNDSQLIKCKLSNVDAYDGKIINCHTDMSYAENCFIVGGKFDGEIKGGVVKNLTISDMSEVSPETKFATIKNNFFDTSISSLQGKKKDIKNSWIDDKNG